MEESLSHFSSLIACWRWHWKNPWLKVIFWKRLSSPCSLRTESQSAGKSARNDLILTKGTFRLSLWTFWLECRGSYPPCSLPSWCVSLFQWQLGLFLLHHQWPVEDEIFNACSNICISSFSKVCLGTSLRWRWKRLALSLCIISFSYIIVIKTTCSYSNTLLFNDNMIP